MRRNPDLLNTALTTGLLVGGVWVVHGIAAGTFDLGQILSGTAGSNTSTQPSPQDPNAFNFNADASQVYNRAFAQAFGGHIGWGHVGPGGDFVLAVKVRNRGLVLGIGGSPLVTIYQSTISPGSDGDWNGYGMDLDVPFGAIPDHNAPSLGLPNSNFLMEFQAEIWGASNGKRYAVLTKQIQLGGF